jgi:hypothetical protein
VGVPENVRRSARKEKPEINRRPWLEALKQSVTGEASQGPGYQSKEVPKAPVGASKNPTVLCQSAGETQDVADARTAGCIPIRGEHKRRLIAAGWEPKKRGGLLIWASPETGFYCSQEVALLRLETRGGAT